MKSNGLEIVASKRILVSDEDAVLPVDARKNLHPSFEFGWEKKEEAREEADEEQTKHAALHAFIEDRYQRFASTSEFGNFKSYAPVRIFRVFENAQKLNEEANLNEKRCIALLEYLKRFSKQVRSKFRRKTL